jgi:hypothetical protein
MKLSVYSVWDNYSNNNFNNFIFLPVLLMGQRIKILEIFITHFILYNFKTIYIFKIKFSLNKNLGNMCTVLI